MGWRLESLSERLRRGMGWKLESLSERLRGRGGMGEDWRVSMRD